MSEKPDISANLELNITDYSRNIRRATREADDVDAALDGIVDAANKAEKSLNELSGDIDVKLDADFSSLLDADKSLQRLDTTITPLVDVQVANETAARNLLEDFNSTLTTKINVEDSELKDAQQLVDKLDSETVNVKVNADASELSGVEEKLTQLRSLAVIDVSMQLGEMLAPENIPLLGAIADQDKATRLIAAGTVYGGDAEALGAQAEDVFTSNFGASREEAARGLLEVQRQTKDETGELAITTEDFGTIAKDAFATAANTGEDFNSVLDAADKLVRTGLVPSYREAFDVINNGFNEGLNKGGDLLDTVREYSSQFADLGFDASQFFSVLGGGLDAGAYNTDFVGDLFKEINIRAQAASSGEGVEFDAFKALGLTDEVEAFNAGEMTGAEFASGLMKAVDEHIAEGGSLQSVFDAMGTKAEDLTIEAVIALDPLQVQQEFAEYDGVTMEVSAQLGGDIGSSVETLRRTVESELATSVSKAFDIPGKIQQLSDGVSKFSSLLSEGFTVPEAIEVAFQIPGFAETVATLESALGNLAITVLEVAANILQGLGQGEAAAGIRTTVTDLATQQLAFDLKLADDGDAFSRAISTAVNRGVEGSDLQAGILTAGREFIDEGELDKARSMVEVLQQLSTAQADVEFAGGGVTGAFGGIDTEALKAASTVADAATTALAPLNTALVTAENELTAHFDTIQFAAEDNLAGMSQTVLDSLSPVETQISTLSTGFDTADTSLTTLSANAVTNAGSLNTSLSGMTNDVNTFAGNAQVQFNETTVNALNSADTKMLAFGETVTGVMLQAGEDVQGLIDKLLSIAALDVGFPSIGGSSFEGAPATKPGGIPGEAVGGVIPAGETHRVHGGELMISGGGEDVAVLNRQTSSVIDAAVAQYMASAGGGGGGNVTNNYVTVNNVFNNSGAAASTASLDAARVRGF